MTRYEPSDGILDEVYAAMDSEADLDGLVIATLARIGEVANRSAQTVLYAIDALATRGKVVIVNRNRGVKEWNWDGETSVPTYHIGEYQLTEYL